MMTIRKRIGLVCLVVFVGGGCAFLANVPLLKAQGPNTGQAALVQPQELVNILKSRTTPKPLIIQVGFRVLYMQAHIPGSEFIGPAASPEGIRQLHNRLASLPRTQPIVIYCGCCPWSECPNMNPAYREIRAMGFQNVKSLYIPSNFGRDWVEKGFPTEKGQ
jgi:thiosulfate/3-mercaptopyruvate sulfurtransferase